MFSLNLKDVIANVTLPDKTFTGESEYDLIREVRDYLSANHHNAFPNPVTAMRKLEDAVKNANGDTLSEAYSKDLDERVEKRQVTEDSVINPIREKYRALREVSSQKYEAEHQGLLDQKLQAETEEAKEQIRLKVDELTYTQSQDFEESLAQEQAEVEAAFKSLRPSL